MRSKTGINLIKRLLDKAHPPVMAVRELIENGGVVDKNDGGLLGS